MRPSLPTLLAAAVAASFTAGPALAQAPAAGVPVTVAQASKADVPVLYRAIGTVQAFQSVLVRVRVDGTLDSVRFQEGQHVKAGDVLAQLDPRPYQAILDGAAAKRAADDATLTQARLDLARYNELAASQVASRQKLEQMRAAVAQNEAVVRGDDAALSAAQLNLSFTRVTAPIAGRVGLRNIDPGNLVRAADPSTTGLVTLAQLHPISLIFTLPQDLLPQLQAAMKRGTLPVTAYAGDDKTLLAQGSLVTIDSLIDATTGTIKLKAAFDNKDDTLWPGQFVATRIQFDVLKGVTTIPSAAVQRGVNGLFAFTVRPDGTAAVNPIELSQDDGTVAVVARGVAPGDTVVLTGQSRLTTGTRVAVSDRKPAS